ncbi:hypothetical protein V5799_019259 [Amblyomma americanum]|uniref:DNA topoisomerase n=1 Tax=Amblyomma americanum TaxID=6943 RepID=A0AAQ4EXA7_AMBAM
MLDRDCSSKRTFNENFFHDWRRCMTMREAKLVRCLAKCDFAEINAYYKRKAEERKAMTAEQKQVPQSDNIMSFVSTSSHITKLALRAGNEKEEGRVADTVGCCSLRVEHITLHYQTPDDKFVVQFDFLGKDAVRYVNAVAVDKRVFDNLELFIEDKEPEDDLFDLLSTGTLNKHLNELMEGLTAKVFRTYNASRTFEQELDFLTEGTMTYTKHLHHALCTVNAEL